MASPSPTKATTEQSSAAAATEGIGEKLTTLRVHRGVKVSELARQIGVSPSLISQIERGQSRPSVSTLFAMAEALDVPVDAFFRGTEAEPSAAAEASVDVAAGSAEASPPLQPSEKDGESLKEPVGDRHRYVVRKDGRPTLDIEGGVRWERLTPRTLEDVEFLELAYAPRAESNPTLYRHPGREMVLVLSGRLQIIVGFETYDLEPGDSMQFPSSLPHRYVNQTDEEARAVTVILHESPEVPEPAKLRGP